MKDLNARIKQLTNLILTSQTVDENRGDESRPASPSKVDFDMTPYQVRAAVLSPFSPLWS
jgi:centromeric protein E